ncbi:hypothetical protein KCU62_g64, partial [Aureobasidium sp. EXF-3399]
MRRSLFPAVVIIMWLAGTKCLSGVVLRSPPRSILHRSRSVYDMEIHGLDKADFAALMQEPVSSPERTSKRQHYQERITRRAFSQKSTSGCSLCGRRIPTQHTRRVGQQKVNRVAPSIERFGSRTQLSHEDLVNYFAGAPEFEIRSLRPRVSYRWKLDEESGEPQDFVDVSHRTFEAATLRRRERTRQLRDLVAEDAEGQIPMMEVPNMLSLNGNEPGTIGLEYFLQMPLADSKRCAEDEDEAFQAKRQLLATSPEDLELRPLNLEYLIHRLREIGDSRHPRSTDEHHERKRGNRTADELHTELFSNLLVEPEREEDDPPFTNLEGQVVALARVLVTTKTWYDFSLVEHRIRLGQILWPSTDYDDESANDVEDPATPSERDILLLQIALACELLIRVELSGFPTSGFSRKLRWDLVLAQRFLDSINIAPKTSAEDESPCRNSFMSIASFVTARESLDEPRTEPIMFPRHEKRQVAGLLRFAEALAWPHTEEIQERFAERVRRHSRDAGRFGVYGAALGTPSQVLAQSNYFAQQKRPQVGRTATAQSLQLLPASAYGADAFDLGGWLSRSWLTGFVLPGESTSHLLISTLLENSPSAVAALGDAANLYQGFVYKSRSYWSKSCVVGRVIAAANAHPWINGTDGQTSKSKICQTLPPLAYPTAQFSQPTRHSYLTRRSQSQTPSSPGQWMASQHKFRTQRCRCIRRTLPQRRTSRTHTNFSSMSRVQCKAQQQLTATNKSDAPTPLRPTTTSTSKSRSRSGTEALSKELPAPPTHPLHCSYAVEIIPAATILADDFTDTVHLGDETVVLDCRGTGELQLLARAWCAKVGENAVHGEKIDWGSI